MNPHIESRVPKEDAELFRKIRQVVEAMPNVNLGSKTELSCHMLTRALARFFPVRVCDGTVVRDRGISYKFLNKARRIVYLRTRAWKPLHVWSHSWLKTKNEEAIDVIIDPYPWAMLGGPILVLADWTTPWGDFYREEKRGENPMFTNPVFEDSVRTVSRAVRDTLRKLEPNPFNAMK